MQAAGGVDTASNAPGMHPGPRDDDANHHEHQLERASLLVSELLELVGELRRHPSESAPSPQHAKRHDGRRTTLGQAASEPPTASRDAERSMRDAFSAASGRHGRLPRELAPITRRA